MPDAVRLTVTDGPMKGAKFSFLEHNTFIFGRDKVCHAHLPKDAYVSRHHFLIEIAPPEARLRDLGSLNGTYVNTDLCGARLPEESPDEGAQREYPSIDLKNGDSISVGETKISVSIEVDAAEVRVEENQLCRVCGKQVASEFGNRVGGSYVCIGCRSLASPDPIKVLADLNPFETTDCAIEVISLDEYQVVRLLGLGGMGAVYLAEHLPTHESVALKVILSTVPVKQTSVDKFLREVEVLRSLRHPNIVGFRGGGAREGGVYLAMEYCNGRNVAQLMADEGGSLSVEKVVPIMQDTLQALSFAHDRGIIHRDIKPGNILLHEEGGVTKAKLCDFGLAKSFETAGLSGMTATSDYAGTLAFVPTEQITNYRHTKPVSDVWSLGATCYKMLTGEVPRDFNKDDDPIAVILRNKIIPIRKRRKDMPKYLTKVIDRAIAPDTAKRYQTGTEFLSAFKACVENL